MQNNKENIRIIDLDSIIVLLILFIGLLIYNSSVRNSTDRRGNPVRVNVSVSQNSLVSSPGLRFRIFQKTWVSNKDNFNLLAFNRNPLSEDKKIAQEISHLQNIRKKSIRIPVYIFHNYLFPVENDDVPLLS
jgi:hypothetical protein